MSKDCLDNYTKLICFVTTQYLLQKWLREKHKIFIQISYEFYTTGVNYLYQIFIHDPSDYENISKGSTGQYGDNVEYETYEQALEEALQNALKLIK